MEDVVKQRIRDVLVKMNSNPTQLAKKYSMNQKTLNNQINSDVQLSASTILLVLSEFDKVSAEWLLRGEGEMIKGSSVVKEKPASKEFVVYVDENGFLKMK
jgi:hypothetical protein